MSTNRGMAADCYLSSHLNEQHTRKSKGRKSQQSVQEIYRIMSKASSWKTEFSQESETCCSLSQIKNWMSDTWPVTSFQSAGAQSQWWAKGRKACIEFQCMALVTDRGVALCVSQCRKKKLPLNLGISAWHNFPECHHSHHNVRSRYFTASICLRNPKFSFADFHTGGHQ